MLYAGELCKLCTFKGRYIVFIYITPIMVGSTRHVPPGYTTFYNVPSLSKNISFFQVFSVFFQIISFLFVQFEFFF